ncbi:hypothetical protein GYB22_07115 [bacterium]|nr:hypothetical protein [bacterium]
MTTWPKAINYVSALPYGRNANRCDPTLVLSEEKGTCSSKHALLKMIADHFGEQDVELIMGIYLMDPVNTPGVKEVLNEAKVDAIPEAHCYLKIKGAPLDVTFGESNFDLIQEALLEEQNISPEQVSEFKVEYHKKFLQRWLGSQDLPYSFDELWAIRERCIAAL